MRRLLLLISILIISLTSSHFVLADSEDWYWSRVPNVTSSDDATGINSIKCNYQLLTKYIDGQLDPHEICLQLNGRIIFGIDTEYLNSPVASFRNGKEVYSIKGLSCLYGCIYLPETDSLAVRYSHPTTATKQQYLTIYKNFSKRLTPEKRTSLEGSLLPLEDPTFYILRFNSENPDYILQTQGYTYGIPTDYQLPIGGMGSSENGRWLAVEVKERGIGLLDISNLEMYKISNKALRYNVGRNPHSEFSISNDGNYIAMSGVNLGLDIFNTPATCRSSVATETDWWYNSNPNDTCTKTEVWLNGLIDSPRYGFAPTLNTYGNSLSFYLKSYTEPTKFFTLHPSNFEPLSLDYLALGDSFTSGEGELIDANYIDGTNEEYDNCHLSINSYPFRLGYQFYNERESYQSVACSGAETVDIINKYNNYYGQGDRLLNGEPDKLIGATELNKIRLDSLDKYFPGRIYQSEFVTKYQPEVITVGIGGNDAGLMEKLQSCILSKPTDACEFAKDKDKRAQVADEIQAIFPKLVATYRHLHEQSLGAKIIAIGYPRPVESSSQCDLVHEIVIPGEERFFINQTISLLNKTVEAAAKSAGIGYIDIYDAFGDQTLCGEREPSAFNGLTFGDDVGPHKNLRMFGNESFHPNALGHALSAAKIIQQIQDIDDYQYCTDYKLIVCPESNINGPVLNDSERLYWYSRELSNPLPILIHDNFIRMKNKTPNKIVVDEFTFKPISDVYIEFHSEPINAGEYTVNEYGGLSIDIVVPEELDPGFHELHIFGESYTGEQIDLYQGFQVPEIITDSDNTTQDTSTISTIKSVQYDNSVQTKTTRNNAQEKLSYVSILQDNDNKTRDSVKGVSTHVDTFVELIENWGILLTIIAIFIISSVVMRKNINN